MGDEDFDVEGLANYLHLAGGQVVRLAERGKIPARRVAGAWRFSRPEIHHWLEERIGLSAEEELAQVEDALSRAGEQVGQSSSLLTQLLPVEAIAAPLTARTRNSAITAMVDLASATGWLWDPEKLATAIRSREELHPTALENGVALMHPRRPLPGILERAFVALGCTPTGIPFGGSRGVLTDVFFLVCSTDDRSHLHALARISRLIASESFLTELRSAESARQAHDVISAAEQALPA